MRHGVVAALALLGIAVGFVRADYAVIRVNLGQTTPKTDPKEKPPEKPREDPNLSVVIFVEYEKSSARVDGFLNIPLWSLKHRWGSSYLDVEAEDKQFKPIKYASVTKRYKDRYDGIKRKTGEKQGKDYLEMLEWAVGNNMLDESLKEKTLMADFLALKPGDDARVAAAQKACKTVMDKLAEQKKNPLPEDEAVAAWKKLFDCRSVSSVEYPHYTMLYDAQTTKPGREVFARLDRLELNFRQFYYYFALRGQVLPFPEKRLMVFLVSDPGAYREKYAAFDGLRKPEPDGFYARRDNLLLLSTARLDTAYDTLAKMSDERLKTGWDYRKLVTGRGGVPTEWGKDLQTVKTPDEWKSKAKDLVSEYISNQTMALVLQSLVEEAELGAISFDGTRQLMTAAGFLPRNVMVPDWVNFGLPSVFETPRYDSSAQAGSFWPIFGEPNWVWMAYYKVWELNKAHWLEKPPEVALTNVLTDRYFFKALPTKDPAPLTTPEDELVRAKTMAWALSYYLVHRHLDGLIRYGKELDAQPRDLEMDEQAKLLCFARAFGLVAADKPDTIDTKKFNDFAKDWQEYMSTRSLPAPASVDDAKKSLQERRPSLLATKPTGN